MTISRGRLLLVAFVIATSIAIARLMPEHWRVVLEIALMALFVVTLLEVRHQIKQLVRARSGSYFDDSFLEPARTVARPADLTSLEKALGWRTYDRKDFEHRVVPVIRRLASARLLEHRGIDADDAPTEARAALPPGLASVVFPATSDAGSMPQRIDGRLIEELLEEIESL